MIHVLCFRFLKENKGIFILQNCISLLDIKNFRIEKPCCFVREFKVIDRENDGIRLVNMKETCCDPLHFLLKEHDNICSTKFQLVINCLNTCNNILNTDLNILKTHSHCFFSHLVWFNRWKIQFNACWHIKTKITFAQMVCLCDIIPPTLLSFRKSTGSDTVGG